MVYEDGTSEVQEPKKKSPLVPIMIVVLVLIIIGGAAGAYFFIIAPKAASKGQAAQSAAGQARVMPAGGSPAGPIKDNMESFIVNLTDAQGTRYIKVSVKLEMNNEFLNAEIDRRMPQIRDEVIMLLSSKSFDDVSSVAGKKALKRGIINGVNKHLSTGQVTRVFFTEFVVQ